jgi:hypothetical protein
MKKIHPAKIVHENRGRHHGTIRFDVQRFGRNIFRKKKDLSAEKKNISSAEKMSFEILEIRLSRKCYPPS